ncbi:MAG TPA: amidophosphoribosyltransferase, partial [Gallionella sp.]|nr:amidophosphoribosyltransferase [Gallionella sp.]
TELIATGRSDDEICREIGADGVIYQDLEDLKASVRKANPAITAFDASCFDGQYITGDITPQYLDAIEARRSGEKAASPLDDDQMELNLAMSESSM